MTGDEKERFGQLDAMRGFAAFAVVIGHLAATGLASPVLPNSYLAVDFFFILSGFVIAHSYEARMGVDLSTRAFVIKRLIRLYPLAVLGALGGLAVLLLKYAIDPAKVADLAAIVMAGLANTVLLPNFVNAAAFNNETFPINGPLWTLSLEVAINLIWALALVRMRFSWLLGLMLVAAAGVAWGYWTHGPTNLGWSTDSYLYGVARVTFGFIAGLVLYRARHMANALPVSGIAVFACAVVLLFASFRFPSVLLNIFYTLVLYPALVLALSRPSLASGVLGWLGEISFPLYALHFPVLVLFAGVAGKFAFDGWLLALAALLLSVVASHAIYVLVDKPLRRALGRRYSSPFSSEAR